MNNTIIKDCESKITTAKFLKTIISIKNCSFTNMTGLLNTGVMVLQDSSSMSINDTIFFQNYGIITSNFLINNCFNISFTNITIILKDNLVAISIENAIVNIVSLQIIGSQVYSMKKLPKSIVNLKNLFELNMHKCRFIHINSFNSPIQIYFDSLKLFNIEQTISNFNLTIDSTEFINCSSYTNGGALYLMSYYPINITNCTFLSNFALESGGAIFYFYYHPNHTLIISNCTFKLNFAGMEGGSIKYTNSTAHFQLINNHYETNFAYYGNNLAGFLSKAIIVKIISYEDWINNYSSNIVQIYSKYFCNYLEKIENNSYANYLDEIENNSCAFLYKNLTYYDNISRNNISVFLLNISKGIIVKDKIIILLLDDNNQIVSTINALCNIEKTETKLMNFDSQTNLYQFNDTINQDRLNLSRLQIYFPNEGVIIIDNFIIDYIPGLFFFI